MLSDNTDSLPLLLMRKIGRRKVSRLDNIMDGQEGRICGQPSLVGEVVQKNSWSHDEIRHSYD